MKNCCKTNEKPSTARKIFDRIVYLLIGVLFIVILISILFKQI